MNAARVIAVLPMVVACGSPAVAPDGGVDATIDVIATNDAVVDVAEAGSPEGGFYGIPWNADALDNDQIGYQPKRQADIRFRSKGGTFVSAKVFFIAATYVTRTYCNQPPFTASNPNNCYAAGTGGTIRVDLVDDDGTTAHAPATNVLASQTITDPMNVTAGAPIWGNGLDASFRVLSNFSAQPTLVAGKLYHLLFTNIDAAPTQNYVSIDCLYHSLSNVDREPGVNDTDLAVLLSDDGTTWTVRKDTAIFQINYQDGHAEGQGYMGTRVTVPEPIAGAARARETFTPAANVTVTSVSVRLRVVGTPSPVNVRLERSDGTLVEEGTLDASAFSKAIAAWATLTFTTPHLLTAGTSYDVMLTAPSGSSSYSIYPLEKGTQYGFDPKLVFGEGHADYDDGDAGFVSVFKPWGSMKALDYQLYFKTE